MVKICLSIATLTALAVPAAASAFELGATGTPLAYSQRDLTLRQGQLRIDAGPPDFALLNSGFRNQGRGILRIVRNDLLAFDDTIARLGVGGAFGVLDELEVGTLFIPVQLSPNFEFLDMEFYGRFKFLEGDLDVAGQVTISLPTNTIARRSNFGLVIGAPAILRLSPTMRLDVGAELELILGDADLINLDIPAALQYQITDTFFAGPKAGLFFLDFDQMWIGVGGVAGFTIPGPQGAPLVDILGELYWPSFLATGPGTIGGINLDQFNLIFGARVFFSLLPTRAASPAPSFSPSTPLPETEF